MAIINPAYSCFDMECWKKQAIVIAVAKNSRKITFMKQATGHLRARCVSCLK